MFNYYACRKIAAEELSRSINDLTECQKQKKLKGKLAIQRSLVNLLSCVVCRDERQAGQEVQAQSCGLR